MPQSYTPEFKKKIIRLHLEEGRTYKSITADYGVSKASISKWCREFSKECQTKALENPDARNEIELMKENLRLRKELEEAKKEKLFLKKHEVRYHCTILDLYDRSVIASITDRKLTSDLAICTLKKTLEAQPSVKGRVLLHSDQGTQYTSKAFTEFCES